MSMITKGNSESVLEVQQKEIRALALQAAATIFAGKAETTEIDDDKDHVRPTELDVLDVARFFENYIEEGRIPSDER